jgi:hypothetical protein
LRLGRACRDQPFGDREQVYTRGYWKLGVADHPDHDTGED